jgi:hypothetical protein
MNETLKNAEELVQNDWFEQISVISQKPLILKFSTWTGETFYVYVSKINRYSFRPFAVSSSRKLKASLRNAEILASQDCHEAFFGVSIMRRKPLVLKFETNDEQEFFIYVRKITRNKPKVKVEVRRKREKC